MPISISRTFLPDLFVIEPQVFHDHRGCFFETWNETEFSEKLGRDVKFVQDNQSISKHRVLRGLHYQFEKPQGKLVRVVSGEIFDVAVDLRSKSTTFGKWFGIELSAENKKQLWIPEGFAHGFVVLSSIAEVAYKTTGYWHPSSEKCIRWNDSFLNIGWPNLEFIISQKDECGLDWINVPKF
jgi:dTDP-4-dehydrorhamnose 3,5-epimerase